MAEGFLYKPALCETDLAATSLFPAILWDLPANGLTQYVTSSGRNGFNFLALRDWWRNSDLRKDTVDWLKAAATPLVSDTADFPFDPKKKPRRLEYRYQYLEKLYWV